MSGKRLLDSNIIIDLFRGDRNTIEKVKEISKVYVPVIVIGELYYGANRSNNFDKESLKIENLENKVILLNCDRETALLHERKEPTNFLISSHLSGIYPY